MIALNPLNIALLLVYRSLTIGSGLFALIVAVLMVKPASAQITPDATLGNEGSVVVPEVFVRGDLADVVEGGAVRGENLFHSFLEFNVDEGQRVYFANPDGIESILSRITGGNASNIFGTLGVNGMADLLFLNPNGILFGEDASLDVEGSFYASTADAIGLGDEVFSAVAPRQSRLLSVSPSVRIESYLSGGSGGIENRGQIVAGENLGLAASRLDLQGQIVAGRDLRLVASDEVRIRDSEVEPFVALSEGDLLVQGNEQVDIVALSHADSGLYGGGSLTLRSAQRVGGDAHYWSGGDFRVEVLDGSPGGLYSPIDPIIRTFGDVEIDGYRGTSLHILAGGAVTIGTAIITGSETGSLGVDALQESVVLSDGTRVAVDGLAQPTLDIRAGVRPEAIGAPPFDLLTGFDLDQNPFLGEFSVTDEPSNADITVGDVFAVAPGGLVLLTNQYEANPNLTGGSIFVTGEGVFGDGIDARSFGEQGGTVFLDARDDISVVNSFIATSGLGEVGDIVLIAQDAVQFDSTDGSVTGAFSILNLEGTGIGGDVLITARNLEVTNGAQLSVSNNGEGDAGNVILDIAETARFDGFNSIDGSSGGAFSSIGSGGTGSGGDISIATRNLEVTNGAILSVDSFGVGNAGNVILNITETARFEGFGSSSNNVSGAFSSVQPDGEGTGGDIVIYATNLMILQGATVFASNIGRGGDAGSIELVIANRLLVNDGTIATTAISGSGGAVDIQTGGLVLRNDGDISTFVVSGDGDGGDIIIAADFVIALDDSDILAFAVDGNGGNIDLSQTTFFGQNLNIASDDLSAEELLSLDSNGAVDIAASGQIVAGQISVVVNDINELAGEFISTETLTASSCIARRNDTNSSFIITGSEGLPQNPVSEPVSAYPISTIQTLSNMAATQTLQEPEGVYQLADGRLVLSHRCER